jgi:hypothetical protein
MAWHGLPARIAFSEFESFYVTYLEIFDTFDAIAAFVMHDHCILLSSNLNLVHLDFLILTFFFHHVFLLTG